MQVYKNFMPKVSVVLPTYNRQKLLERAINSVVEQTFLNWELIIIDDGSTDLTFEIVKIFQNSHENIRYIKQTNMGLPIALNAGISISCGEFITFLGSDDEYKSDHLQKRIDFLKQFPETAFLSGGVEIIGSQFVPNKWNPKELIHLSKCVIGGTFFGKKEVFIRLDGFRDISYSEDSDFFERLQKTNFIYKEVDFQTYIYHRENQDSITNSKIF